MSKAEIGLEMYTHTTVCFSNIVAHFPNDLICFISAVFHLYAKKKNNTSCLMNIYFLNLNFIIWVFSLNVK